MRGLILFAHGSSVEPANEAVRELAKSLALRSEYDSVQPAFLELASPNLADAVGSLVRSGHERIVVVPYFLVPGRHLTRDLPGIVEELRRIYPSVPIEITESLAGHALVADAVLDRARTNHPRTNHGGGAAESTTD